MDMKEIGACGILVVGGAAYGISQFGLNDVLSEDLRHFGEVSAQERPAYMEQVVDEFKENFDMYTTESETYVYVGSSNFMTAPASGKFVEIVTQDEPVPAEEIKGIKASMVEMNFCAQDEMTMFTDQGWIYSFTMQDSRGTSIFSIKCKPVPIGLKQSS